LEEGGREREGPTCASSSIIIETEDASRLTWKSSSNTEVWSTVRAVV